MKWSLRSINHRVFLFGSFVAGMIAIGSAVENWGFQKTDAFSWDNISQLYFGAVLLFFSYLLSKNKRDYPLKKQPDHNRFKAENSKTFHPKIIELSTNIHGFPVTHACGAPSPIRLKAVQLSPVSDSREDDYEKFFYNWLTGEVVAYDKTKADHRELMEHFLWMISSSGRPSLPKSYLKQHNVTKDETDTLH
ncbi:MAG: hypothetical protein CO141_00340 [Candidatus Moranbacteria bacterium CG_4_9_14_3_um_filter_42_9]|nr:MAG: hypothetical protein CO141_00340 [Candidatus Moranbacteria bacterium CG_4_9_14_3_um_filter_42_9]